MRLDQVFGIGPSLMATYVERIADEEFKKYIRSRRHLVVFGSSKQGKTSLRKKHLKADEHISISCQSRWDLTKLYMAILKQAGYEPKIGEDRSYQNKGKISASIKLRGKLPFVGHAEVKADAGGANGGEITESFGSFDVDPYDPNDIMRALHEVEFKKWIVLDDFHYLPQETQRDFAAALKAFFDESDIRFVIIAVWRERNRISSLGDLALRCVSIDADTWLEDELLEVISKGESALNIRFPERLKRDLVNSAFGSVYVVQEVCLALCADEGIEETQAKTIKVGHGKRVEPLIDNVINQFTGQYRSFFVNFSHGFQSTDLQMYKWLLLPVILATPEKLRNGIPLTNITSLIRKHHSLSTNLNPGNITQALKSVSALQSQQNIKPFILDYDENNRVLNIVDRSFALWIGRQERPELLDEIGLPAEAYACSA